MNISSQRRFTYPCLALVALSIIVGALMRLWACQTEFSHDEVWAWMDMQFMDSPLKILTYHRANNHYFYTLWLYILGGNASCVAYRLPSLITGVGSIVLMAVIAGRAGKTHAVVAAVLTALCFPLIFYSSEARGYASAVFFTLLCLDYMQRYKNSPKWPRDLLFSLYAVSGILCHLTFLCSYFAIAAWAVFPLVKNKRPLKELFLHLSRYHLIPMSFLIFLYFVDLRVLHIDGGPKYSLGRIIGDLACTTYGIVPNPTWSIILMILSGVVILAGLALLWANKSDKWVLYVVGLPAPIIVILLMHPSFIHSRYCLVCLPLFLLLLTDVLVYLSKLPGGRVAVAIFLSLYCGANSLTSLRLCQVGRGRYLEALQYMTDLTKSSPVMVGSNFPLQARLMFAFYRRYVKTDKDLQYWQGNKFRATGNFPTWIIISRQDRFPPVDKSNVSDLDPAAQRVLTVINGYRRAKYQLVQIFERGEVFSGSDWLIYHLFSPGNSQTS